MQEAIDKAKSCHIPVISVHSYADEHIPIQEIIEMFGSDYLKNTVSYMIAYALFKGYDKLRLYGIDQGPEWTYIATKPYVTHWLGIALGRGIKYELAPSSTLREMFTEVVKANMKDIQRVSQHKLHFEVMPQSKQGMHEGRAFYSKRRDLVCEK